MAIQAVTTAALLSAPLLVLLFVFGHMVTSAPTELCLEGCVCYNDINNKNLKTVNCTSFRPVLTAASSLLSDFSSVQVLNVQDVADGSSVQIIDGLFGVFSRVKYMNLINASINKIDPSAFKGLKHLEELDLSNNHLYKFRPETFTETPKLKLLDLTNNPLRLAPNTFLFSKSLEVLILASCNLTSLPAGSFKGLQNLKTLDLYDNQIQVFTIRSFPRSLKQLWLTKNNLTNISTKALTSLNKLTRLDLSDNPINCTCSLIGLQDWFSSKGIVFENDVTCKYPFEYEGESWTHVFENEVCLDNDGSILTSKKEYDTSENSCENEICDESTIEDRYIYNAVQADQPITEIVPTVDYPTSGNDKNVDEALTPISFTTTPEAKESNDKISDVNKIETITENIADDSKMNESKNLVEDVTSLNDSLDVVTLGTDPSGTQQTETIDQPQDDNTNFFPEVTTQNLVVTEVPSDPSSNITGESLIDGILPSNPPTDQSATTLPAESSTTSMHQNEEITTFKSDLSTSEVPEVSAVDENQSAPSTTDNVMTVRTVIEETTTGPLETTFAHVETSAAPELSSTVTPTENPTTVGILNEDSVTVSDVDPTTLVQTSTVTPVTILPTDISDSTVSTTRNDEAVSTVSEVQETTTVITTTTVIPIIATSENSVDENSSPNTEVITSTSSIPSTTTETTIPLTETYRVANENQVPIETTTTTSFVETTTFAVPTPEKTNHVPDSKEETTEAISTTEKVISIGQQFNVDTTNKTEATVVLPSTDNRKGKMMSSTEDGDQKPAESMGSYIVLAGIIIVLLLLILYATTKKSKKSSNKKIPLQDAENNMTELQDMTTLLPSSPVTNGNKNNKYPNEEPSVTAKLLETDDQPDTNGNGFVYPPVSKAPTNKIEAPEKGQESNGKSTLPRTNGSSNGAPPLELTKAKVLVMHDSLPRTPIYIQKNVNS